MCKNNGVGCAKTASLKSYKKNNNNETKTLASEGINQTKSNP